MKNPNQKEAWLTKIVHSNTYNGVMYILLVAKKTQATKGGSHLSS
jgi:hypothetical protein